MCVKPSSTHVARSKYHTYKIQENPFSIGVTTADSIARGKHSAKVTPQQRWKWVGNMLIETERGTSTGTFASTSVETCSNCSPSKLVKRTWCNGLGPGRCQRLLTIGVIRKFWPRDLCVSKCCSSWNIHTFCHTRNITRFVCYLVYITHTCMFVDFERTAIERRKYISRLLRGKLFNSIQVHFVSNSIFLCKCKWERGKSPQRW